MRNSLKWRNAGDLVALGTALPLGEAPALPAPSSPRVTSTVAHLFTLGGFIRKRRQKGPPTEKRPKGNESSVCSAERTAAVSICLPSLLLWPSAAAA